MAKLLKLRRGTTTQHASFTGAEGEVTVDTTKDTAVVHDGSQAGGRPLAREDMTNVSSASIAGRLGTGSITGAKLENSGVSAGSYGSSSAIPIVTVDAQGLVTAASTTAIDSTTIANGSASVAVSSNGPITSNANHDFSAGIDVTGNVTVSGTVDGVDIAALNASALKKDGTNNGASTVRCNDADFIVQDDTDGTTNFVWRDHSASKLYLGTDAAVVTPRSHVIPSADSTFNIGSSSVRFSNGYFDTLHGDGSNLTGVQPFPSGTKMLFQQTAAPTGWTKVTSSVDNKALRIVSGTVGSGGNQTFTGAFASRTPAGNIAASGNSTASWSGNATTGNSTASFSGNTGNSGANTSNTGPSNTGNAGASTSSVSTSGSVSSHTLTNNQVPSHSHSMTAGILDDYGNTYATNFVARGGWPNWWSNNTSKNTSNSGGGGSHNHGFSGSSHSHNVNNHTHSVGNHSHSVNNHTHSFSGNTGNHTHSVAVSGNTGNHTHNSGGFSGSAMDFAVQYLDVIIASKD